MQWKAAGLAVVLVARAAASAECRQDVEARLSVLAQAYDDQLLGLDIWAGSWGAIYTALAAGQGAAALAVGPQAPGRQELFFGSLSSMLGVLTFAFGPLRFRAPLERVRAQWGDPDRCALLARAEQTAQRVAREQALAKSWLAHAGSVLVNVGIALALGFGFGNWRAALLSGGVGLVIGEVNLLSQPTKLQGALDGPKVRVVPLGSRDFTGAGLTLTF